MLRMNHHQRIALVCGASKGLGFACADALLRDNAQVIVCSSDGSNLQKAKSELEKKHHKEVLAVKCDLNDKDEIKHLVGAVLKKYRAVHILINNTGGPKPGSFFELDEHDFLEAHNRLLLSVIRLNRLVIPVMQKQKFGRIISLTSQTVKEPSAKLTLSSVYRVGVVSLSKILSKELAKDNIFINSIAMGSFDTERMAELLNAWKKPDETIEQKKAELAAGIPSKKLGSPKDLGALVSFLASEECALTGTTIPIDGGMSQVLW